MLKLKMMIIVEYKLSLNILGFFFPLSSRSLLWITINFLFYGLQNGQVDQETPLTLKKGCLSNVIIVVNS